MIDDYGHGPWCPSRPGALRPNSDSVDLEQSRWPGWWLVRFREACAPRRSAAAGMPLDPLPVRRPAGECGVARPPTDWNPTHDDRAAAFFPLHATPPPCRREHVHPAQRRRRRKCHPRARSRAFARPRSLSLAYLSALRPHARLLLRRRRCPLSGAGSPCT
jgi:hypothetical protein